MHDELDTPEEAEAERLLRAARPQPADEFVAATERRLLGRAPRARRRAGRPVLAGLGLSAALAAVLVVAGLAGSGPLAPDGDTPSKARDRCHDVRVTRQERVGEVVIRKGRPEVVKRDRTVMRTVRRCS